MADSKRRLSPEDVLGFKWVSDPQMSPCGTKIAYVETRIEDKKYRQNIWIAPVAGGSPVRFTNGPKADKSPRWSPDGTQLAFVSDRDGTAQIWTMDVLGGEAMPVTKHKAPVSEITWSPDGKRLAFVSKWAPADDDSQAAKVQTDVKVITRLRYKADGKGFWDGKYSHIYIVDAAGGDSRRITSGEFDHTGPAWAPDGKTLAFSANRTEDADYENVTDIWVISADGGEPRQVTRSKGPSTNPSFSPDGSHIAYVGHDNAFRGATLTNLWVTPVLGGDVRNLTPRMTIGCAAGSDARYGDSPARPLWSNCGCTIAFIASKGGTSDLYKVHVSTGEVKQLSSATHAVFGLSMNGVPDTFAVAGGNFGNPGDIYTYSASASKWTRLTTVNKDFLDAVHVSMPERMLYKAADGWDIEGWAMKPVGFKDGTKYPAVLEIHGGPHSAYGCAFFLEFQLLAANGYAVIFTNPRGSEGYGQEFVAATKLDWGNGDYKDIISGVDHAISLGWIDADRLGLTGGSYGGYMTNWAIGQTDRFKAAVACRSTSNRYSQFGVSDAAFNNGDFEFPGTPWESPDYYLEKSPITYAKRITTPLLLISNENDLRCPICQAEEMFVALKLQKKTVEMVRIPGESHELSRAGQPVHRIERYQHMMRWFKEHLPTKSEEYCV